MNPQTQANPFIGVDVAKSEVVTAVHSTSVVMTLANEKAALTRWLTTLPATAHLGVESTGGYHGLLCRLAHARGLTVYVLNPKDVHHYAKALGTRAKTDRVDAQLIARYLYQEHEALHPWTPPTPAQERLGKLLQRRAKLVVAKGMLHSSLAGLPGLASERAATLRAIERLVKAIDRELKQAVAQLPEGPQRLAQLRSIPGIGLLSGTALTTLFMRLGFTRIEAAVAYTGFDPRPCDSGQRRGRRRLSKRGPSELRRLLYNAAMAASRTAVWKPFYERQRAKGLSTTAALVVLARKLVRVAYALYQRGTAFNPRLVTGLP